MDILQAIGNTSMVRLRKVVPPRCADVLVKLEWENATGSMKDRMAHAVISRAEADGRLKPGGTVVLTLVPSEGGRTTKKLILDMIETARGLSQEPNTYWSDS
jgi:cysteine synthase